MRSWPAMSVSALAFGLFASFASPRDDEATIREHLDRFVAAFSTGDAEGAALVYTDPHIDLNAARPLESRAMTAERFRQTFDRFDVELRVTSDEIVVNGDWAFQRGEFYEKLTPKGGGKGKTIARRYVEVLKRQSDGSWLVYWGMDGPRAEAP